MKIAIILISEAGFFVARILNEELEDSTIVTTMEAANCLRVNSMQEFIANEFNSYDGFVFIGAMGICVRMITPHVKDKHTDPAVVCIDNTGRYAISVLSGHVGGANELTSTVASILGAEPVITTYSDRTGLWALDTLGARFAWDTIASVDPSLCEPSELIESTSRGKKAEMNTQISLFVNEHPTALLLTLRDAGTDWLEAHLPKHVTVFYRYKDIDFDQFELFLCVAPNIFIMPPIPTIYYLPQTLHIGVGLARDAGPVNDVMDDIFYMLSQYGVSEWCIASVSSVTIKQDEPVMKAFEEEFSVTYYPPEELADVKVPTPSETVMKYVGTPSVCEASAVLSSCNPELLLTKVKGANYTFAAAVDHRYLRRGHIEIVGAGPGDPDLISVRGRQMLERADLILYAGSLVPRELTTCAKPGAVVRSSASMNLEEQFAMMKEFYDKGRFIVRLHTGDPCIYGAIQEQMNLFDLNKMSYHITPGISSFQAAAAALKSQFTIPEKVQSIILTRGEGRTPMPEREKLHLLARSQSTMCIFLSAGIAEQVQEELLQEYPENTPVAVCYHLTWKDERIYRGVLKDLAQIVRDNNLTLTTMIVVGEAIGNREGLSRLYADEFKHLFRK
ncbi:MAG: precorrin-4 C(11)-methyltransferase [Bacteroides sp.]|nr:precorrin-4 C(11)-methyltransferase [Bacteroides sp.]